MPWVSIIEAANARYFVFSSIKNTAQDDNVCFIVTMTAVEKQIFDNLSSQTFTGLVVPGLGTKKLYCFLSSVSYGDQFPAPFSRDQV